jgi:uncharacterized membrane protein
MNLMLAAITGQTLIHVVIWVIIAGLIFFLVNWLIGYVGIPEPFNKVAKVIAAIIAVIFLINALLLLVDKPFIRL